MHQSITIIRSAEALWHKSLKAHQGNQEATGLWLAAELMQMMDAISSGYLRHRPMILEKGSTLEKPITCKGEVR